MRSRRLPVVVIILCLPTVVCGRRSEPATFESEPAPTVSTPDRSERGPVRIEMKDVNLHMDEGIVMDVTELAGTMVPTKDGQPPVFDDPHSYVLKVSHADLSMDMASLTVLLNQRVFAGDNAPLSDIKVTAEKGRLKQKGTLHKGLPLAFSVEATVSAAPDGRLRLHTESARVLGIPSKTLMEIFGLELEDVVKIKEQRGVQIEGDDVLIDPGRVLPPPVIQGRLANVDLADGRLHQVIASDPRRATSRLAPTDSNARHYVYFSGNDIRFGKLLMSNADLQLIDADERDPFDFYPAKYTTQLVAGYSKNTPSGGLRTYMPDYNDVTARTDLRPGLSRQGPQTGSRPRAR